MIEFKALAIKAETDELHTILLLKKNVQADIIKTILGYPPIAAPEILKKWKVVITSVGQGYESTEGWQDYQTGTGTTYGERGAPMDIGKAKDNFDKNERLKCFNCNVYGHIAKDYKKPKKKQDTIKYYKCEWVGHMLKTADQDKK